MLTDNGQSAVDEEATDSFVNTLGLQMLNVRIDGELLRRVLRRAANALPAKKLPKLLAISEEENSAGHVRPKAVAGTEAFLSVEMPKDLFPEHAHGRS